MNTQHEGDQGPGTAGPGTAYPGPVSIQTRPEPGQVHPALAPEHGATRGERDSSRLRPPARRVVMTAVTDQPLDAAAHEAAVSDGSSGAVVTFRGLVRDHDGGRSVTGIEYVGHPTAPSVLADVVAGVTGRSECEAVAVSHRVGPLAVGDIAIVVSVSAVHRQEAFAAAAELVDEVKHLLPVWKRQEFPDGSDEWVACP